jgi:hypothetical protein
MKGQRRNRTKRNQKKQSLARRIWLGIISPVSLIPTKLWAIVGVLATISGVLSLFPNISVAPATPLDPTNLFSTPFTISNDGYLPIYGVTFRCRIRRVHSEGGGEVITSGKGIYPLRDPLTVMRSGEKSTVACPFPVTFDSPIVGADFDFVVAFRPIWIPWHRERFFRFGTAKNKEGQLIWLPRAVAE